LLAATFRFVPRSKCRFRALLWSDEYLRAVPLASFKKLRTERCGLVSLVTCLIVCRPWFTALHLGAFDNISSAAHFGRIALGLFALRKFYRPALEISNNTAGESNMVKTPQADRTKWASRRCRW